MTTSFEKRLQKMEEEGIRRSDRLFLLAAVKRMDKGFQELHERGVWHYTNCLNEIYSDLDKLAEGKE